MYGNYKTNIPEGESGNVKIEKFIVTKDAAEMERIRAMFNGGRGVPEGEYTRLLINNKCVMSDTPDEIRDHLYFIDQAKGRVLINGLGLGICLHAILEKSEVEFVTVIEISEHVINLVRPYFNSLFDKSKFEIIHADALEWKPPKGIKYDAVWHDIWPDICTDNYDDMKKLHRRYGRKSIWQDSWSRDLVKYHLQQEKQYYW